MDHEAECCWSFPEGKKGERQRDILTVLSLVQTHFCSEGGYLCLGYTGGSQALKEE